jgi:hypothetical protein
LDRGAPWGWDRIRGGLFLLRAGLYWQLASSLCLLPMVQRIRLLDDEFLLLFIALAFGGLQILSGLLMGPGVVLCCTVLPTARAKRMAAASLGCLAIAGVLGLCLVLDQTQYPIIRLKYDRYPFVMLPLLGLGYGGWLSFTLLLREVARYWGHHKLHRQFMPVYALLASVSLVFSVPAYLALSGEFTDFAFFEWTRSLGRPAVGFVYVWFWGATAWLLFLLTRLYELVPVDDTVEMG